jgi:acetyl-CoA carboxylase biotin carboxylase subunit
MIRRLLIANRGEIAMRIIRACRELGVETVAVYSDADASSPHALAADRAIRIGPAAASESYLSIRRVIDAAVAAGADAVHPGYGFLSENAAFAEACARAGIVFVGPPPPAIARMGDKIEARRAVADAGAPIVPGETPEDQSDAGIRRAIDRVGLPVLVKAAAGGGGKGMREVYEGGDIGAHVQTARREALAAFGNGTLYVERLVPHARHVEVQIFADAHGGTVHLFERECSVQRRHQKVIEESPSPALMAADPALRGRMTAAAVAAASAVAYRNAGTVEFLVDSAAGAFYFLEMNTRLQVEHGVTESVTGVDLVRAQLMVASGERLPWQQAEIATRGHAIEARVYAEDPARGFVPQPGRLLLYREPRMPGVRIDSGVTEGGDIPVQYDPLIAKVIASAETRSLAIARLCAALRAFPILGVRTNVEFLIQILEHQRFQAGTIDTGFLDREGSSMARSEEAPEFVREATLRAQHFQGSPQSAIRNPQSAIEWDPWQA